MQPYFLPYTGYFQLIKSVDKFIFLDDVNFIKGGWINRNKLIINNQVHLFTLPVSKMSQNRFICDTSISHSFNDWSMKFIKTVERGYRKAPNFEKIYRLIVDILHYQTTSLSKFIINSIQQICTYLEIPTDFSISSDSYNNRHLSGAQRIIDICHKENAKHYLNPQGGRSLYNTEVFAKEGILLEFFEPTLKPNSQNEIMNISSLSIINDLMHNKMLNE